ncbi:MAG TPA: hypothetical protein VG963_10260, partial [Polyangiaceae bacterium]|nr:hypothetical protein [Polyangiaceae bacterium]
MADLALSLASRALGRARLVSPVVGGRFERGRPLAGEEPLDPFDVPAAPVELETELLVPAAAEPASSWDGLLGTLLRAHGATLDAADAADIPALDLWPNDGATEGDTAGAPLAPSSSAAEVPTRRSEHGTAQAPPGSSSPAPAQGIESASVDHGRTLLAPAAHEAGTGETGGSSQTFEHSSVPAREWAGSECPSRDPALAASASEDPDEAPPTPNSARLEGAAGRRVASEAHVALQSPAEPLSAEEVLQVPASAALIAQRMTQRAGSEQTSPLAEGAATSSEVRELSLPLAEALPDGPSQARALMLVNATFDDAVHTPARDPQSPRSLPTILESAFEGAGHGLHAVRLAEPSDHPRCVEKPGDGAAPLLATSTSEYPVGASPRQPAPGRFIEEALPTNTRSPASIGLSRTIPPCEVVSLSSAPALPLEGVQGAARSESPASRLESQDALIDTGCRRAGLSDPGEPAPNSSRLEAIQRRAPAFVAADPPGAAQRSDATFGAPRAGSRAQQLSSLTAPQVPSRAAPVVQRSTPPREREHTSIPRSEEPTTDVGRGGTRRPAPI